MHIKLDDIKLIAKNKNELETLIQIVRIYCKDVEMESDIEKCAILKKREKTNDGRNIITKLRKNQNVRIKKKVYKCLGILEADTYSEMRTFFFKEYFWRTRKRRETKQYLRTLIKVINSWAVPLVS